MKLEKSVKKRGIERFLEELNPARSGTPRGDNNLKG
jgi:hypothetical protein